MKLQDLASTVLQSWQEPQPAHHAAVRLPDPMISPECMVPPAWWLQPWGEFVGAGEHCVWHGVGIDMLMKQSLPAGCDNEVKVWDLQSNQQSTMGRHDGPVRLVSGCCCTPDLMCSRHCHVQARCQCSAGFCWGWLSYMVELLCRADECKPPTTPPAPVAEVQAVTGMPWQCCTAFSEQTRRCQFVTVNNLQLTATTLLPAAHSMYIQLALHSAQWPPPDEMLCLLLQALRCGAYQPAAHPVHRQLGQDAAVLGHEAAAADAPAGDAGEGVCNGCEEQPAGGGPGQPPHPGEASGLRRAGLCRGGRAQGQVHVARSWPGTHMKL